MIVIEVISWLPTLFWVALVGLVLYWGFSPRAREARGCLVAAIAGGLLVLLLASMFLRASLVFVQPTDRGVVISALDEGMRPNALQPGLNFVVPLLENVLHYPVTRQTYTLSIAPLEGQIVGDDGVQARTSDGQIVLAEARLVFRLDPERVVDTHKKWRGTYVDNLVRPVARGVIREVIGQHKASEINPSTRSAIEAQITQTLAENLEEGGLLVHDFELWSILSPRGQPNLLERSGAAEPEPPALSGTSQGELLERIRSILQTLACIALPIAMIAAVIARRRRPAHSAKPNAQIESSARLDSAEQVGGHEEPSTLAGLEDYEQGLAYLEQARLPEAKAALMRAFRNAEDPQLKEKVMNVLEALGEVTDL